MLRDLGQNLNALHSGYSRTSSVTPGRDYTGTTKDFGLSGEVDYDLGAATLTSITAYRHYNADQGGDIDYSTVDILYRDPGGASRRFNTFSQELRLQGNAFNNRLDWLVGAYYANEDLALHDNLKFGSQYGRFATCRIVSPGGLSALYSPTSPAWVPRPASVPARVRRPAIAADLLRGVRQSRPHEQCRLDRRPLSSEEQQLGAVHAQHFPRDFDRSI